MMASAQEAKAFIAEIGPLIHAEAKKRGYKVCSAVIAQACIESNYGLSKLSAAYFNYFGMKCGKSWKGKSVNMRTREEYTAGTLTTIRDNFRVYDSMADGISGYYDFISVSRYSSLKTARTELEYLERIKAAGYATSSTYVSTCLGVVNKYGLTRYDEGLSTGTTSNNPFPAPDRNLRHGMTGTGVKWLQYELSAHGYTLNIDGIFGPATELCVRMFQSDNKLSCDGIVGPLTIAALIG
jgi:flagellum-specific peptidoglycan hydrolase FlgJ